MSEPSEGPLEQSPPRKLWAHHALTLVLLVGLLAGGGALYSAAPHRIDDMLSVVFFVVPTLIVYVPLSTLGVYLVHRACRRAPSLQGWPSVVMAHGVCMGLVLLAYVARRLVYLT